MLIDADIMRILLVCFLLGMMALGLMYLRRRSLSFWGYLFYGVIVVFLPLLGPFWVIAVRPGKRRSCIPSQHPGWFLWLNRKLFPNHPIQKFSQKDNLNQKLSMTSLSKTKESLRRD